ncbi:MAG: arginine deiminase-related protein, partial [Psychrosphaera sp.]|nr:arginine deiminase-related protein [Psychrosphaera sp.]
AVKALLQQQGVSAVDVICVENAEQILEGTGAIVFDHAKKLAYAALSERCHEPLLNQFCQQIGYQPVSYSTCSSSGHPIYHTNVVMSVGQDFVVACVASIVESDRQSFVDTVQNSGKTLVEISLDQMEQHYCGNILELQSRSGKRVLALSQRAWAGFTEQQQAFFESRMTICANDITTIETIGGGSMRCMLAEVFNPTA